MLRLCQNVFRNAMIRSYSTINTFQTIKPSCFIKTCHNSAWASYETRAIRRVHDYYEENADDSHALLHQVVPPPFEVNGRRIFLVGAHLDLYQYAFEKNKSDLTDTEQLKILSDIQLGVSAVHNSGMVHNDIKPENVLLSTLGHWQLADFEGATYLEHNYQHALLPLNTTLCTPHYSPNVPSVGSLTLANDMWSIGATMHVIRYCSHVIGEYSQKDENEFWGHVLSGLLDQNPHTRITVTQLGNLIKDQIKLID